MVRNLQLLSRTFKLVIYHKIKRTMGVYFDFLINHDDEKQKIHSYIKNTKISCKNNDICMKKIYESWVCL